MPWWAALAPLAEQALGNQGAQSGAAAGAEAGAAGAAGSPAMGMAQGALAGGASAGPPMSQATGGGAGGIMSSGLMKNIGGMLGGAGITALGAAMTKNTHTNELQTLRDAMISRANQIQMPYFAPPGGGR